MPDREQREPPAACADVTELLPVYLGGGLEADEARRVEAHLAGCSSCRQEERDTRTALALYDGHLPVELLLDYAFGASMSPRSRAVVESHVAACTRCAEELALVREQHSGDEGPSSEPASGPRPVGSARARGLRLLAWAACLATLVASTGWIWTWRQLEVERAHGAVQTPRVNIPVVELLPAEQSQLRGGDAGAVANRLDVPEDSGEIVLVLLSGGHSCASPCVLEVDETGGTRPVNRLEGLVSGPDGHLTLTLSRDWLSSGRSVLAVRDETSGELVAAYLVEVPARSASE